MKFTESYVLIFHENMNFISKSSISNNNNNKNNSFYLSNYQIALFLLVMLLFYNLSIWNKVVYKFSFLKIVQ